MKALILAGGFGTRLRPLSCTRPKILFPILNKPLLNRILERLASNNIRDIILAVDLQTEVNIRERGVPDLGLNISYSRDPVKKPLGTGGPIKKAEKLLNRKNPFLVLNGDILSHLDYQKILDRHKEKNATVTIALHPVKDPSRYGSVEITKGKKIIRFIEKPSSDRQSTKLINAGIYVLNPEIFEYIPKEKKISLEREIFPKLVEEGKLYGYVFDSLWADIGTIEGYRDINKILLKSCDDPRENKFEGKGRIERPAVIGEGTIIGEKCIIGPYTVLGENVAVGKNVNIQNSIIFPRAKISDSSSIYKSIIGEQTFIGKEVKIGEGCVLGDQVRVEDQIVLSKGVTVCAGKRISESVLTNKNII